eukprot:3577589-Alexandrium_andersonii.AAC.1
MLLGSRCHCWTRWLSRRGAPNHSGARHQKREAPGTCSSESGRFAVERRVPALPVTLPTVWHRICVP